MPTILRIRGFRIGFYQADLDEPMHVHVRRQEGEAKFWMNPVELVAARGFRPHEVAEIHRLLEEHVDVIVAAWRSAEAQRGNSSGEN